MKYITTSRLLILLSFLLPSCSPSVDELYNRATKLQEKGRYKEAIAVYNKILSKNPKLQDASFEKAYCYLQDSNYSRALYHFRHTLSLKTREEFIYEENPDTSFTSVETRHQVSAGQIYYYIGVTQYEIDSFRASYRSFRQAIEHNYEIANCYSWLGSIWICYDSTQKGCMFLQKAREMGEEDADRLIKEYCE